MAREIGRQAFLERPIIELEQAWLPLVVRVGVDHPQFRDVGLENIAPEVRLFSIESFQIDLVLVQLALKAVRQRIELLLLGLELREGDFILFLELQVLLVHIRDQEIELMRELLCDFDGAAAARRHHLLPRLEESVIVGFLLQKANPAFQKLRVQLVLLRDTLDGGSLLTADFPGSHYVILCLREQDLRVEIGGLVEKFLEARFFRVELLFLFLVVVHDGLGHLWIGLVMRTGEDAGEAVVIARRDSVVLVIMAAGAPYGQAEKRLCRYVKLVMPFVGALDGGGVVLVTPDAGSVHSESPDQLRPELLVQQVCGKLCLDKEVVGKIVVYRTDQPVAIEESEWILLCPVGLLGDAVIVFAIPHDVHPVSRPSLTVARRGEQPVNNLLVGVRRLVAFEGLYFFICRRQSGEAVCHAAKERSAVRSGRRFQTFLFQACKNESVQIIYWPCRIFYFRHIGSVKCLNRP